MPFDSTRMIPKDWSSRHQPVVIGGMNARVIITDPARTTPGAWDAETGTYGPPTPYIVAGGPDDTTEAWRDGVPARIQQQQGGPVVHAEEPVTTRQYLVQLPASLSTVAMDHRVTALTADNDAALVDVPLTVTEVLKGSERFTRDVICQETQHQGG